MSLLQRKTAPVLITGLILLTVYLVGAVRYQDFAQPQVALNLLVDNAHLLVVAIGMTFVILTGGIDLSVGAVVALASVIVAVLLRAGWPVPAAIAAALLAGVLLGFAMGCMIQLFEIQPFIVTLAGLFLARGLAYTISYESVSIKDPGFTSLATGSVALPGGTFLTTGALVAIAAVAVAAYVLHQTRFGRRVYAVGGSERSALLMGVAVGRTKIAVYTISGFCSALGGVLLSFYLVAGSGTTAVGLELDAIAAVVIGGTVLTGGSGYLAGTVLGVGLLGIIQTVISFEGTLSSWWTRIIIGALLFVFILLQRLVFARDARPGWWSARKSSPTKVPA
jgi:ribose/xylose/arabinose/galactoside ABC-type transport system permease subunit